MYLWKVYFTNGNFALIWADMVLYGDGPEKDEITLANRKPGSEFAVTPVARFNRNNIAGYENCKTKGEADTNDKN